MTSAELAAMIGIAGTLIGVIVAIINLNRATSDKIKEGDDALHDRINRVRDDYVRRVDLDGHLSRLEKTMGEAREESREGVKEINRRLDTVLTILPTPAQPVKRSR